MKVLIVENELYLAQSIMSKLEQLGFSCLICGSTTEALSQNGIDVVLLSTNISGQNFYPVIEKYKDKIIILLVSYISHDTVGSPIEAGAKDYILKPFMIDELVRKIKMFQTFEKMKIERNSYSEFAQKVFNEMKLGEVDRKLPTPFLINSNNQRAADAYAFNYAVAKDKPIYYVDLEKEGWRKKFDLFNKELALMYAGGFDKLRPAEKKEFLQKIEGKPVIFSSLDSEDDFITKISVDIQKTNITENEIMSIDDYLKLVIEEHQDKYPDTELSRKLGMSRKSLWEKRKKYGITKKK